MKYNDSKNMRLRRVISKHLENKMIDLWEDIMKIIFEEVSKVEKKNVGYSAIMANENGKWLFVRHKDFETWEIPVGKREVRESPLECAKRELYEASGATLFHINEVCAYNLEDSEKWGILYVATIVKRNAYLYRGMLEVVGMEDIPENIAYEVYRELYQKAVLFHQSIK